jgi:hypothetical protein
MRDNQTIDPLELASKVESGVVFEMGIVLRKPTAYQKQCPRCRHMNSTVTAEGGWIAWQVPPNFYK